VYRLTQTVTGNTTNHQKQVNDGNVIRPIIYKTFRRIKKINEENNNYALRLLDIFQQFTIVIKPKKWITYKYNNK